MADEAGGTRNKRLGRGLAALIGDVSTDAPSGGGNADDAAGAHGRSGIRKIRIEYIRPNPRNPRKTFSEDDLSDLTESVREKGVVQPILVRPSAIEKGTFELIAGERRWRAAQKAGLHEMPAVVRDVTDQEALELAIIENVQRADLNPIEEALGYDQLVADFNYSQAALAKVIGKSRSHVANTMRLLKLPNAVKDYLAQGLLTAGHARALITVDDPAALAEIIVQKGLSVRDAEKLAHDPEALKKAKGAALKPADTVALEKRLSDGLGLAVAINNKPNAESGELKIKYKSLEQLDQVCRLLGVSN
ncbi:ParB/RepB/Spo0J family partition protein [Breoghania sp.]|uniref:ParB/RepB/Spo0J family partition protein n=1 Tax=Breoghania sp. TaxID=2065378 RepID=UPI002608756A|nr:ParB/RepB/Spo0J family partition protein [Breoghania sp.]MDJ0930425.1 ParB/RepB/Spo0J family partition protein [Breoghania sp.]